MKNVVVISALSSAVSVFWNFNFWPRYSGKCSLCPWNQRQFPSNSDKSLLSPKENKLKEIWDIILQRQKIAEDNNAKINVSLNIFYIFLVFKASAFLQILFPKNLLFRQNLRTSVFLDSKCLTFLYLFFTKEHPLIA